MNAIRLFVATALSQLLVLESANAWARELSPKDAILAILVHYQQEYGELPYHPDGGEVAMSTLLEYWRQNPRVYPGNPPSTCERNVHYVCDDAPFEIDPTTKRFTKCKFNYVNLPHQQIALSQRPIIILSRDLKFEGEHHIEFVTSSAQYFRVAKGDLDAREILGQTLAEIYNKGNPRVLDACIDDVTQWLFGEHRGSPYRNRDFNFPFRNMPGYLTRRLEMERMHQALGLYQESNGYLPYDARGSEYALYALWNCSVTPNDYELPLQFDHSKRIATSPDFLYLNRESIRISRKTIAIVLVDKRKNERGDDIAFCFRGEPQKKYNFTRILFTFGKSGLVYAPENPESLFETEAMWEAMKSFGCLRFRSWWEEYDRAPYTDEVPVADLVKQWH